MMFKAGLKTVADLAILTSSELCRTIKNINITQAGMIIKAAKLSLMEKHNMDMENSKEVKNVLKAKL